MTFLRLQEGQRFKALIFGHVHGKNSPNVGRVDRHAIKFWCRSVLA
jgi:hypothetical protein